MDDEALRAKLEKHLGYSISDVAWHAVLGSGYAEDARLSPRGFDEMVEYARDAHAQMSGRLRRQAAPRDQEEALFDIDEALRARTLYEYFAFLARTHESVQRFRDETLGGELLTLDAAVEFLTSPANAWFGLKVFQTRGVSPVGHKATLESIGPATHEEKPVDRVVVRVEASGKTWTLNQSPAVRLGMSLLSYPRLDGQIGRVRVNADSVLDDLRTVVHRLIARFPWQEQQAVMFVLTDHPPVNFPIRREVRRTHDENFEYHALTFVVEPWVSAQTVLRAYRTAQRAMLRGRENRPISRKNLLLFGFCLQKIDSAAANGDDSSEFPALKEAWNATHPSDCYSSVTAFRRAYHQTMRQLVAPDYGEPW